jgi:ribosomal protein S12 methylthiotransferase accessory factor
LTTRTNLRLLAEVADYLVDPRLGVVLSVDFPRAPAGAPEYFHASARLGNLAGIGWPVSTARMDGAAPSREAATLAALAEALSFYCAAFFRPDDLPLSARADALFPCAAPADFALYSPAQYARPDCPWQPFTDHTPVRWAPACSLVTGAQRFVPAATVFFPYPVPSDGPEAAIVPHGAGGLATGCSRFEAEVAAVCSAVKSDALCLAWQARLALPQIRVETLDDANYQRVEKFESVGGEVTLFDATSDLGIPTILAALRNAERGAPARVFAGATDPSPRRAVAAALDELALVQRYCHQLLDHVGAPERHGNPSTQVAHLLYWSDHSNSEQADFLFTSRTRVELDELPELAHGDAGACRRTLLERLSGAGHEVLAIDLTTRDLCELGLWVVRVVVPSLARLVIGPGPAPLGGARLSPLLEKLRAAGGDAAPAPPHPFLCRGIAP